jgi:hypothetical protein
VAGSQQFLLRLDPLWEQIIRFRAPYTFVSTWAGSFCILYLLSWLASVLAYWRIRPTSPANGFIFTMPLIGLLSVPIAYFLLEALRWAVITQVQPARALLWVVGFASILGSAAALRAPHWLERFAWFGFVFSIPLLGFALHPNWPLSLGTAALATVLFRIRPVLVFIPILALFFLAPAQHLSILTPDLAGLINFARTQAPPGAMFAFPDAGHALEPGVFRAQAVRSVYVDWKSGGQVNYFRSIGLEWWDRWNHPLPAGQIDFEVRTTPDPARQPIYQNRTYSVYRLTAK